MALCEVKWFSNVLQKHVGMMVILPEVGKPPYPAFYLLHGLSDDYTGWLRRTRIEWYMREYPMIVVMPDGFRGWYAKHEDGPDCEKYVGEETVDYVDRFFPTKKTRAGRCIGGLSMGGYGAMRLGFTFPTRFCSVTSHSGALIPWRRAGDLPRPMELTQIFGKNPSGTTHDLIQLARTAKQKGALPRLRLDCGVSDEGWIKNNRTIHQTLTALRIEHEYEEYPGGHEWDYWDLHIREAIAFHARNLKIKTIPAVL